MGPIKLTRWQSPGTVFQSSLVSLGTYTAATLLMKVGIFGEIKGLKSECHPGAEKKNQCPRASLGGMHQERSGPSGPVVLGRLELE